MTLPLFNPPFNPPSAWRQREFTKEETDKLVEMWQAGKSYSQIAAALGRTRNSCISKGNRLGLKRLPGPTAKAPVQKAPEDRPREAKAAGGTIGADTQAREIQRQDPNEEEGSEGCRQCSRAAEAEFLSLAGRGSNGPGLSLLCSKMPPWCLLLRRTHGTITGTKMAAGGEMMGKRSSFPRIDKDAYDTWDPAAVKPLRPLLPDFFTYAEPCAGAFSLCTQLNDMGGQCRLACDIQPRHPHVIFGDFLNLKQEHLNGIDYIITNPPWSRPVLHEMIDHALRLQKPTWFLFDADWMHTQQSIDYLHHLHAIVSVGRVKWIANSAYSGKDNVAWYLFDGTRVTKSQTKFYGRA